MITKIDKIEWHFTNIEEPTLIEDLFLTDGEEIFIGWYRKGIFYVETNKYEYSIYGETKSWRTIEGIIAWASVPEVPTVEEYESAIEKLLIESEDKDNG